MQFKEVIGQEEVKKRLINSVKENRISHAQLFYGLEGSGKLALALAYAQYINCENPGEEDSCGTCNACNKYQKLIHPDLHFVFPVSTNKIVTKDAVSDSFIAQWRQLVLESPYFNEAMWYEKISIENKQGLIGKDESQEIIRKLNLKTFEADYKVMIIWLPEKMNASSANKLLKILEEPPKGTVFLLVSEDTERIIQTILSRTQLIKVPKISSEDLSIYLMAKYDFNQTEVSDFVHIASGNYIRAINAIHMSEESEENFKEFVALMRLAYQRQLIEILAWAERMAGMGRERLKRFFDYGLRMMRESYIYNFGKHEMNYLTKMEKDFVNKFSPFIVDDNIHALTEEMNKAAYHIERNGYPKIVLTDFALRVVKLIRK